MTDTISAEKMAPRFETGRPVLVAGLKTRYNQKTRANIPAHWDRFAPSFGKIPGQIGASTYGVCWNFDSAGAFDYLTGVEVSQIVNLPSGFSHILVPARRYAVFTHPGHVSSIPDTLQYIWCDWRPESGYDVPNSPSFERYGEGFNPKNGVGDIEIWVPVEA